MAFPLMAVLTAAPGVIASVSEIVKAVRTLRKRGDSRLDEKTVKELEALLEQQAVALSALAESNRNLALAVRNNRIVAAIALLVAIGALAVAFLR